MAWFTGTDYEHKTSLSDFGLLKRFWVYMKPYKWPLIAGLGMSPIMVWLAIYPWIIVRQIVDEALAKNQMDLFVHLCLVLLGLLVLEFFVKGIQAVLNEWVGQRITRDMRQDVFGHLLFQNHSFFDRNPIGKITTRVTNDIENLGNFFASGAIAMVTDLLKLVAIAFTLFSLNATLTIWILPLLLVISIVVEVIRRRLRTSSRAIRDAMAMINGFVQEYVMGALTVQLYGQRGRVVNNFDRHNKDYFKSYLKNIKEDSSLFAFVEWAGWIVVAIVMWYGGVASVNELVTLGTLITFIQLLDVFFGPIKDLSAKYAIIQSALASLEKIFGVLETDSKVKTLDPIVPTKPIRGELSFEGVNFAYAEGKNVLNDVSFTIQPGEKVALVGHTGSGKSTLFKLLLRFYEPGSGVIKIDNIPLNRISPLDLYQFVGMVSQDIQIFEGSLMENLTLNNPVFNKELVMSRLSKFNAEQLFPGLYSRLDSPVQAEGKNFSSGERQLISILRAMLYDPSIVFLDEATSSVDSKTEETVQLALATLFQNRTVLVIAHRLATVKACDRLLVMHHGQVAENGSHQELLELNGLYARLYRLQFAQGTLVGE